MLTIIRHGKRAVFAVLSFFLLNHVSMAAYVVVDSDGEKTLDAIPTRVAALNWDIAEQVIELGIVPVAMPDIKGYSEWVVTPKVPRETRDIGTRVEPNYAVLRELKPDVILVASPQKDLTPKLAEIAPVLYYQTYSEAHDNAAAAITNFKRIAHVLGKSQLAENKLKQMNEELLQLKQQLSAAFSQNNQGNKGNYGKPKVSSFRFASTTSVYLYADNSIPQYALQQLGFESALPRPSSQWGITQIRLAQLNKIGNNVVLYFEPFNRQDFLARSAIWQSMPFVKSNQVQPVSAVWSYGGAMSILYNARAMADALMEVAAAQ
ncbi:iron-siderophore ABC transporter substrate-binding protein [Vibrio sp. MA40-2]|uniref:iron-siderophore ABC transporter substrate-binding protein n=1 Tax=Vibrio sp. MA40-2 TaxID=3391828 RepID=UPI0039A5615B